MLALRHGCVLMTLDAESQDQVRVYHRLPEEMRGTTLYPLNELRDREPSAYRDQVAKYEGREALLSKPVPPLGVLWNDVLHMSPVHPAHIRDAILAAGFKWPAGSQRYLQIDPSQLGMSEDNACLFHAIVPSQRERGAEPRFEPYTHEGVRLHSQLPDDVRDYYRECATSGSRPFVFQGVVHVLYRGTIDVSSTAAFDV